MMKSFAGTRIAALAIASAVVAAGWHMDVASAGGGSIGGSPPAPPKPWGLKAEPKQGPPSITLTWGNSGPNGQVIKMTISRNPGPFGPVVWTKTLYVVGYYLSYTDTTASPGVSYSYSVCYSNNYCASANARIRPDPQSPASVRADRQSDQEILVGWMTGDEGTDYFQVQSKFTSSVMWANLGGHLAANVGNYDVHLGGGGGGGGSPEMAVNVQALTNENLMYRVCAGNDFGAFACSDGVHPQSATMQFAPFPVTRPSPVPTITPPNVLPSPIPSPEG